VSHCSVAPSFVIPSIYGHGRIYGTGSAKCAKIRHKISVDIPVILQCTMRQRLPSAAPSPVHPIPPHLTSPHSHPQLMHARRCRPFHSSSQPRSVSAEIPPNQNAKKTTSSRGSWHILLQVSPKVKDFRNSTTAVSLQCLASYTPELLDGNLPNNPNSYQVKR